MTRTFAAISDLLGTDLLDFTGLEESQQQALHARRHLPDLVEEDGAVARHLELPGLVAVRAREAALHVPEQLGLEQVLRQPGAVHRHERRRGPQRLLAPMARATTSLPDPLSPVMSTLASERATRTNSALRSRDHCAGPDQAGRGV